MKRYEWHLMRDLPISLKIVGTFLLLTSIALGIFSWLGYRTLRTNVHGNAITALRALLDTKKKHVEDQFDLIGKQIITLAEQVTTIQAAQAFKDAFFSIQNSDLVTAQKVAAYQQGVEAYYKQEFLKRLAAHVITEPTIDTFLPKDPVTLYLQYYYIARNPNPTGDKYNLDLMPEDTSAYRDVHAQYQPHFRNFFKRFSQYDIFLVDPESGFIIYTVFKEVDFGTNLLTGPYKDTNIARVFKKSLEITDKAKPLFIDFAFYDPSYAEPAAFIAIPIFDEQTRVAVLIFQVPDDAINNIMIKEWQESGLGKTGQSYIVGSDYTMRSNARLLLENPEQYFARLAHIGIKQQLIDEIKLKGTTILLQEVNNNAVKEALREQSGQMMDTNFLHHPVVSVYAPLDIADVKWALIVDQDKDEVFAPAIQFRTLSFIVIAMSLLAIALIGFIFVGAVMAPLRKLLIYFKGATQGSKINIHPLEQVNKQDEIGLVISSLDQLLVHIEQNIGQVTLLQSVMDTTLVTTITQADELQQHNGAIITNAQQLALQLQTVLTALDQSIATTRELIHIAHATGPYRQRLLLALETAAQTNKEFQQLLLDTTALNSLLDSYSSLIKESERSTLDMQRTIAPMGAVLQTVKEITESNGGQITHMRDLLREMEQRLRELKHQLSLFSTDTK